MFLLLLVTKGLQRKLDYYFALTLQSSHAKGPILFRLERPGLRGKTFVMYKFRTMVSGVEFKLDGLKAFNEVSELLKLANSSGSHILMNCHSFSMLY